MTPRLSIYLDAVRFMAAFVVVLSHFAYPRFTGGRYIVIRELNLGSDAVVVFFVLSGFVIDFTAKNKDKSLGRFAFNRATRVYSVAVPAVLATLACDAVGSRVNPAAYEGWWYERSNTALQSLSALTFTNELWFVHLRLGTNGPYWSLTYEVWYYALFAAVHFLGGVRRAAGALFVGLLMGPKILLLAPAWWLGVWAHRSLARSASWTPSETRLSLLAPLLYPLALLLDLPHDLRALTDGLIGETFVATRLGFSDEFIWNNAIAVLVAIHLIGAARYFQAHAAGATSKETALRRDAPWSGVVRWLAGGSFSLYLVHYPTMQCFAALLPGSPMSGVRQAVLLMAVLLACFAFAAAFERQLPKVRRLLSFGW